MSKESFILFSRFEIYVCAGAPVLERHRLVRERCVCFRRRKDAGRAKGGPLPSNLMID